MHSPINSDVLFRLLLRIFTTIVVVFVLQIVQLFLIPVDLLLFIFKSLLFILTIATWKANPILFNCCIFFNFNFNVAFIQLSAHNFLESLIVHCMLWQNSNIETAGFIQIVYETVGIRIIRLLKAYLFRFSIHFSKKSFIAIFFLESCI